jgi:hypothetical protein
MAKQNVKTVTITIPNEVVLKRINSTPTLNILIKINLKVVENTLFVGDIDNDLLALLELDTCNR